MKNAKMTICLVVVCVMTVANFASADTFGTGSNQFTIDFVPISGSTNPASGHGIVNNDYRMGTYEITNNQWNRFKAAYGPVTGWPSYAYDDSPYFTGTDVPTSGVSWFEAAQFVNYLNTSKGYQAAYKFTGTPGQGDYTFTPWAVTDTGYDASNLYRNSNAFYFLPTEDEWIKAGYWNGTSLQIYATKAGETLFQGNGTNGGWNYYDNGYATNPYGPWDVGSGSEELNGTFDMMGNVWEWMETPCFGDYMSTSLRSLYGDSYYGAGCLMWSTWYWDWPSGEGDSVGFRVASVPEPCSLVLLFLGGLVLRGRKK